jgi:hypothetical protein
MGLTFTELKIAGLSKGAKKLSLKYGATSNILCSLLSKVMSNLYLSSGLTSIG